MQYSYHHQPPYLDRRTDASPGMLPPRRRRRRRRSPWRWIVLALILAPLTALAVATAGAVLSGRTTMPTASRSIALRAIADARRFEADHWAPEAFARAELSLRVAVDEQVRQAGRLPPFQNFHPVAAAFDSAAAQATASSRHALERRAAAQTAAEAAVNEASETVALANDVARSMPTVRSARHRLQEASLALGEARAYFESGQFAAAETLAVDGRRKAEEAWRLALPAAARFTDRTLIATWRGWIDETIAWSRSHAQKAIIVYKEKNLLELYDHGRLARTYRADMGGNNLQTKLRANDRATPEGRYRIVKKKDIGNSRYHRALLLDYPNEQDRKRFAQAKRRGEIPASATIGAYIEVHGEGGQGLNWTRGCVALSNHDMDHLFARVSVGTPVTIVGGNGADGAYSDIVRRLAAQDAEKRQP